MSRDDLPTLDYGLPPVRETKAFRRLALSFAIVASLWSVFATFFIVGSMTYGSYLALIIFGPGYIVTAGYWWRGLTDPPLGWTRTIWITSFILQACWLTCLFWIGPGSSWRDVLGFGCCPATWWWLTTTVASAIACVLDRGGASRRMG